MNIEGNVKLEQGSFVLTKSVLIKDTNMQGNVYFANYVAWQGEARESLFLMHPKSTTYFQDNPHLTMVTYCTYHKFINNSYFGDKVKILVNAKDFKKHSVVLTFKYLNAKNDVVIGKGWQRICFMDQRTNSITNVPDIVLELLQPLKIDNEA